MNPTSPENNFTRREFLKVMPLAAAGFMTVKNVGIGADSTPATVSEPAGTRYRNRWYEALRPTARFQVLDGDWQMAEGVVGDRSNLWRKPASFPKNIPLPEISGGGLRERVLPDSKDLKMNWYQRTFTLTDALLQARKQGDRVLLHIGGVAWQWSAWLNEQPVITACLDAMNSREMDVTAILRDGANTIVIAATDCHGLCEDLKQVNVISGETPPDTKGNFIAPAPETSCDPLVWGEVELWVRPATRTEDIFVRPDFRNRKLHVDLEIVGTAAAEIAIHVLDSQGQAQPVKFPVQRFEAAGERRKVTLSGGWEKPRLWEPEDPFLYFAQVTLTSPTSGALLESRRVRFGFREVWIEGGNIMMNGKRLFLARHSSNPVHEHSIGSTARQNIESNRPITGSVAEQMGAWAKEWQQLNTINSVRLHRPAFIRPGAFAQIADELGVMLVPESAYTQGNRFAVTNPAFWANCKPYLEAWVKSARNHPSIVMWSLSNEFLWCGVSRKNPDSAKLLFEQETLVRRVDPTRLVNWDGDWDLPDNNESKPPGPSAMVNLHYPNECCVRWWPTQCWGFDQAGPDKPIPVRGFYGKFGWKPGSKPIQSGEFAWAQQNYFEGPANMTKHAGDLAYDRNYWNTGQLQRQVVKWQTDAWRVARFAGLNPWTHRLPLYFTLMPRETVILQDFAAVFTSGSNASLRAYLLNDTLRDRTYTVRWSVTADQRTLLTETRSWQVVGGEMQAFPLQFKVPQVAAAQDCQLVISVEREGKEVNQESYPIRLRPETVITWPGQTVLFDPAGKSLEWLTQLGAKPLVITSLGDGFAQKAIILGRDVLNQQLDDAQRRQLSDYVHRGGVVLSLGESQWPKTGIGLQVSLRAEKANHAWVRAQGHPVLNAIGDLDLGYWGDDHWVNSHSFNKPEVPAGGAWRSLLDVGSREGLGGAVLAEVFAGRGRWVLNQLRLEKTDACPGAKALVAALLNDLTRPVTARGGVISHLPSGAPVNARLVAAGIPRQSWNDAETLVPLFVDAAQPQADPAQIAAWVKRGGRVWLMGLTAENAKRWSAAIPGGLQVQPIEAVSSALILERDPILWGISNEEFFWGNGVWGGDNRRGGALAKLADIATSSIQGGSALRVLLKPAVLALANDGKGEWLLSTLRLDDGLAKARAKASRLLHGLFTNFGLLPSTSGTEFAEDFQMLSLRRLVNRGFQDDVAHDGKGGWTDEGFERDLHLFPDNISGLDLANLPMPAPPPEQWPSPLTLAGTPFEIIDPRANQGKTCIVLAPDFSSIPNIKPGDHLDKAEAVAVNHAFDILYSLHASAFVAKARTGEDQWRYLLHYQDGSQAEIPVRMNLETADWHQPKELPGAKVAWVGEAMKLKPVGLYVAKLVNPHPEKNVKTLDIVSTQGKSLSGIIALTTGRLQSLRPVEPPPPQPQTQLQRRRRKKK